MYRPSPSRTASSRSGLVFLMLLGLVAGWVFPLASATAGGGTSSGFVNGGVAIRDGGGSEMVVPFPHLEVTQPGGSTVTDLGGRYTYEGGAATTALSGPYVRVIDECGAPAGSSNQDGLIALGTTPGSDCTMSVGSATTRPARAGYFYTEMANQLGRKWLPANAWLQSTFDVDVNRADLVCNAFYDGEAVFGRSGGGCANTGELQDVILFVWGTGLDANDANGRTEAATGIALADAVAFAASHDPCVAAGFFQSGQGGQTQNCPSAIRDMTFDRTTENVGDPDLAGGCAGQPATVVGPFGHEAHCESQLLSGALWDLAQLLVDRYGEHEGWNVYERLLFLSTGVMEAGWTGNTGGTAGCGATSAYMSLLSVDDDDANIPNGTPTMDLIFQALDGHGIACPDPTPTQHTVQCPVRPPVPAVAAAGEPGAIRLSWSNVTGASSYQVFRRLADGGFRPFLPLGSSSTTEYLDHEVQPGIEYEYQVVADAGACRSPFGAPSAAIAASTPGGDDGTPPPSKGAKGASLKGKPKNVDKGSKAKLIATLSPCPATGGDAVMLEMKAKAGWKSLGTKAADAACKAVFKKKMKKTAVFRASSPEDADHLAATSNRVKVKVTK